VPINNVYFSLRYDYMHAGHFNMIISFIGVGTELLSMQLTNVVHKNVYLKIKIDFCRWKLLPT